ncbi:hypothetical protein DL95DRAFT_49689 [Leptodontidium sp. 2 PMI_412]|nr:hypothetical protein DL95DRAFT_49689 [Leptodontidium sp. 2 PMI_412]
MGMSRVGTQSEIPRKALLTIAHRQEHDPRQDSIHQKTVSSRAFFLMVTCTQMKKICLTGARISTPHKLPLRRQDKDTLPIRLMDVREKNVNCGTRRDSANYKRKCARRNRGQDSAKAGLKNSRRPRALFSSKNLLILAFGQTWVPAYGPQEAFEIVSGIKPATGGCSLYQAQGHEKNRLLPD